MKKVLFICLGNICRSPTAHGVFEHLVNTSGWGDRIMVDSAGTSDWHIGKAPDARTVAAARQRQYDLSTLRARQVTTADFDEFDYLLAMDANNLAHLQQLKPDHFTGHLGLFLDFAQDDSYREVPDPYYGGTDGFEQVLDLVEAASQGLLQHLVQQLQDDRQS